MGAGFFIVGWFLWWPFSFFSGWGVGLLFRFVIIIGRLSSNVVCVPPDLFRYRFRRRLNNHSRHDHRRVVITNHCFSSCRHCHLSLLFHCYYYY